IQMKPAVSVPGKDYAVSSGPHQLVLRGYVLEDAAGTFLRSPNHFAFARSYIGNDDGPRQSGALRREQQLFARRIANEGNARSVRRPLWAGVAVDARCDPSQVLA